MTNHEFDSIVYGVILPVLLWIVCGYFSFSFLRKAKDLEGNPISNIRSAAQGYVELSGMTDSLPDNIVYGELTEEPCAWYKYEIEVYTGGRNPWRTIEKKASVEPFLLKDETGECIVLPQGVETSGAKIVCWRGDSKYPDGPPDPSSESSLLTDITLGYRYTETRLELKTSLYAAGIFYTWRTNDPQIQTNVMLANYVEKYAPSEINVLVKSNTSGDQPFILSTYPRDRLIYRFKIYSFLLFIGFLVFTAVLVGVSYPILKQMLPKHIRSNTDTNSKIHYIRPKI